MENKWDVYKLKNIASFNPDSLVANSKLQFINYLDTGNITKGKIDTIQTLVLSTDKIPSRAKRIIKRNDIIYSTVRPNQEHYGIIKNPVDNMVVSTGFTVLRSKKDLCFCNFLYYYLTLADNTEYLSNIAEDSTTAYPSITPNVIMEMYISLPSLPEQRAIAEVLSSLDDKIDLLTRQNATLEALAQTYFRQWFSEGTSEVCLGNYFPIKTGKKDANIASNDGTYLFFTCAKEPLRTDNYSYDEPSILLAGNGDFSVKWYRGKFEAYQRTYVLTPYDPTDLPWLYFAINYFLKDITIGHRGSVINFITKGMIENFKFTLPTDDTFNKYKHFANNIINKQESNYKQIFTLQKLRDTLLPKLISGEVRVNIRG